MSAQTVTPPDDPQPDQAAATSETNSLIETAIADLLKPRRTRTPTPTRTPTRTRIPTKTATSSPTLTATVTPTQLATGTATATTTATGTPSATNTATAIPTQDSTSDPNPPGPTSTVTLPIQRQYLPVLVKNAPCTFGVPDCFEPNDTFDTAFGPIPAPGTLAGTADQLADPFDFYTATLTSGVRYTLALAVGGQDLDLYIYGPGMASDMQASSATSGLGIDEQLAFTPAATGQYYILVYAYRSAGSSAYQLSIAQ